MKTEVRSQKPEDRGQRSEDRSQKSFAALRLPASALRLRCSSPAYTLGLLKNLGVPRAQLYTPRANASFWLREINHLAILETARTLFRAHSRALHPDKPGGSLAGMTALNGHWRAIQRRFKQHGYALGFLLLLLISGPGCATKSKVQSPKSKVQAAVTAAPAPAIWQLTWPSDSRMTFDVESAPTPTGPWTRQATVDGPPFLFQFPADQPAQYYRLGARNTVALEWTASPSPEVTGYRLYVRPLTSDLRPPTSVDAGAALRLTVPLATALEHEFFVTAYTPQEVESAPSNTLRYTAPVAAPVRLQLKPKDEL